MNIFCCINAKGGVGKTTIATNLAFELAKSHRVLVVDLDPQSNATSMFLNREKVKGHISDLLTTRASIEDIATKGYMQGKEIENLDLIPSDAKLGKNLADIEKMRKRDFLLSSKLEKVKDKYDFVFIDSSPQFGLLHWIALNCFEIEGVKGRALIPVEVGRNSVEGTAKLLRELRENFDLDNEDIDYLIIHNKRDERVTTLNKYLEDVLKDAGFNLANTKIPSASDVPKAELLKVPLSTFKKNSKVTTAINQLVAEISE